MSATGPTGFSGPLGNSGETGPTGRIGLQGPRGNTGPYHGVTGYNYTVAQAVVPYSVPSSPLYLTLQTIGTHYNITSSTLTVYLPGFYVPTFGVGPSYAITEIGWNGTGFTEVFAKTNTVNTFRPESIVSVTGLDLGHPEWNFTNGRVSIFNTSNFIFNTNVTGGQVFAYNITGAYAQETTAVETMNEQFPDPYWDGAYWIFKNNADAVSITMVIPDGMAFYLNNVAQYGSYSFTIVSSLRVFYKGYSFYGIT